MTRAVAALCALAVGLGDCAGEPGGERSAGPRYATVAAECDTGRAPGYYVPHDSQLGPVTLVGCAEVPFSHRRVEFSVDQARTDGPPDACLRVAFAQGARIQGVCQLKLGRFEVLGGLLGQVYGIDVGYARVIWGTAGRQREVVARFDGGTARAEVIEVDRDLAARVDERRFSLFVLEVPLAAACEPFTITAGSGSHPVAPRPGICQRAGTSRRGGWQGLPRGWTELPPPPFPRTEAVSVWIQRELFFWGGDSNSDSSAHDDGATFDPRGRRWRRVPDGPLSPRTSAAAVWTGHEVLIWGGQGRGAPNGYRGVDGGAAYNPHSRRWRTLAQGPLSARDPAAAVWTGRELIVWGDSDRLQRARDGAAYDPALDRWRPLPRAPFALNQATTAWTGEEVIIFGSRLGGGNGSDTMYARGLAYDPATNQWRVLPRYPLSPQASSVIWTGEELVAWDYLLKAATYDPTADHWRALPDLPLDFGECYPQSAATPEGPLAWYCGQGVLLDPEARRWRAIADPPRPGLSGSPVAAGGAVLFAGAAPTSVKNRLIAFKP